MVESSVWVHWMVCTNGAYLHRWGNFIKFSSIPTEWRNKAFKIDIIHCVEAQQAICHPMGTKAFSPP